MKFVVYSKPNCPFCEMAKDMIKRKGDEYSVNMLGVDFDRDQLLEMFPDARTFPIILHLTPHGAKRVGGFDDLREYYNNQQSVEGLSI